ncbi:uncharacterized protein LOC131367797 isoform X1 [Hemibagrus wyckioides]|uniref:uncharacterized protein LOC131367797 isoform X1 n=1 Tax=Hemibagrus wyckioides TaxID=337641 RepID=UPI00266B82C3|nr:uncharacterized protein LOC131367797 isoform X1 [Hemibagrus wyckioides]
MAQKRVNLTQSSGAKKIRGENNLPSCDFGFDETFSSSLSHHNSCTTLNPYLTDAIDRLNESLGPSQQLVRQTPITDYSDIITPETQQRDIISELNQTLLALQNSLNEQGYSTQSNPSLIDAVNQLNVSLRSPEPVNTQLEHSNHNSDHNVSITPHTQHDIFSELNQSLLALQNSLNEQGYSTPLNPELLDAVNQLNDSLALATDQNINEVPTSEIEHNHTPLSPHDLFHDLNQSLVMLNEGFVNFFDTVASQNIQTVNEHRTETVNDQSPNVEDVQTADTENINPQSCIDVRISGGVNIQPPSVESMQLDNDENLAPPNVENMRTDNVENIAPPNVENVQAGNVENIPPPNVENVQAGNGIDPNIRIINRDRFNNTEIRRRVHFSSIAAVDSFADFYNYVLEILNSLIEVANEMISPKDIVTVEIRGDTIDVSSRIHLVNGSVDLQSFLTMLENSIQSKREIFSDDTLEIVIQIVRPPRGGSYRRKISTLFTSEAIQKKMRHLYIFHNKYMCFTLCVTQLLNPQNNDLQTEKIARQILRDVGLTENTAVTSADVSKFEKHLKCKIVIIHRSDNKAGYSFFQTSRTPHKKTIYLFLHDNHYYGVKSITGLLGRSYVCRFCHSGYENARAHKCEFSCNICRDVECYNHRQSIIKCPDCLRLCKSKRCFDIHKVKRRSERGVYSLCETGFYCSMRNVVEYRNPFNRRDHVCLESRCDLCGEKVDSEISHFCYIQPLRKEKQNMRHIFYDFETTQETGTHTANLICCMNCRGMSWAFEGEGCVAAFFKAFRRKKYRGYTFIAHNPRGFDSYILLNHLVKEGIAPDIIAQGGKILCFSDTDFRQRYIDSLSFSPMKLSNLPKAMGFSEKKKGYFPHFWNTKEHQDYIGPYPEPELYGVDSMMPKDREDFFYVVRDRD